MNRPFLFQLTIKVMTYDIDFANIVHNAVYIRWLEDLRTELLAETYPIENMLVDGLSPILTKTEIEYRLPIYFGNEVVGGMWVSDLSRVRWTVEAEICVGDKIAAWSRQQGYFASMETLRPVRIPTILQQRWRKENAITSSCQ